MKGLSPSSFLGFSLLEGERVLYACLIVLPFLTLP